MLWIKTIIDLLRVTSVVSMIIELILLDRLHEILVTVCNHFGFKNKHGTDMCVFSLKQVIEYYNSRSSPVYVCCLDESKAFDPLTIGACLKNSFIVVLLIRLSVFLVLQTDLLCSMG